MKNSMSTNDAPEQKSSGTTDDEPTCPNGHVFCPVENSGARDDALECFDCFVEACA